MRKQLLFSTLFCTCCIVSVTLLNTGCKKDKTTEQETITTIELHLTGTNFDKKFYWKDADGDGGAAPVIDEIVLPANTSAINCHVHVYDESKNPIADITKEIEAESDVHLLVYKATGVDIQIQYNDQDKNGKKVGIETLWTTKLAAKGSVNVVLYHEPSNKDDLNNPGGDVDFDVTFPVKVQ